MLGWEFPPYFAGGVGIVCYELTKALSEMFEDLEIEYVMAYGPKEYNKKSNLKINSAAKENELSENVKITNVETLIHSYDSTQSYHRKYEDIYYSDKSEKTVKQIYGANILQEIELYAKRVVNLCKDKDFDVIHAHDWTTVPAALLLKKITGKPVIFHVHITEYDKTGGNMGSSEVMEIERQGLEGADIIVPVSNFTKMRLINSYGADERKMVVIHNGGISDMKPSLEKAQKHIFPDEKVVLFAGRMTMQKGPEFFLHAAKKVLDYEPRTKFILIGGGDKLAEMISLSAELGISKSVLFHGKYTRDEADKFFSMSDCFVMPSVSEPFGIVPLEAVAKGTPAIISKQSGISEVLHHSFKVDFWDTDEMANKIISLIRYDNLNSHMREEAHINFHKFSWEIPGQKFYNLYSMLK